ncbi:hypothetical protein BT67DRAFT_173673 [Trichocladium antarcticum]|uniref:Uncharacterized protein n=1 Tax=Trichocladium antarcticum TaxID=1450529 RepID=A0AAN6UNT5_9PEZI|nr:hypothetical protein BT67DRAFT_173673 [Trichocladium antarcticum]
MPCPSACRSGRLSCRWTPQASKQPIIPSHVNGPKWSVCKSQCPSMPMPTTPFALSLDALRLQACFILFISSNFLSTLEIDFFPSSFRPLLSPGISVVAGLTASHARVPHRGGTLALIYPLRLILGKHALHAVCCWSQYLNSIITLFILLPKFSSSLSSEALVGSKSPRYKLPTPSTKIQGPSSCPNRATTSTPVSKTSDCCEKNLLLRAASATCT